MLEGFEGFEEFEELKGFEGFGGFEGFEGFEGIRLWALVFGLWYLKFEEYPVNTTSLYP